MIATSSLRWDGWGERDKAAGLPEAVLEMVRGGLGVERPGGVAPALAEFPLPDPRVDPGPFQRLLGAEHATAEHDARARHLRGKSTTDLLRLRRADGGGAPDVVLSPADHDEVQLALSLCDEQRIAVVPYGGGTSVVGGLEPELGRDHTGLAAIDLGRLQEILHLDPTSRTATLQPGLRGPDAEALLNDRGYTLGHFPQSFEYATLGGFAAARSSGQASAGYGRFDDLVLALKLATPRGTLSLGVAPKASAGPDLRQLVLGSEGALGIITELTLQIRPRPQRTVYQGWRFENFVHATEVVRSLAQDGPRPTVLRLSDEAETGINLARPAEIGDTAAAGVLAITGWVDTDPPETLLRALGGKLDAEAGEAWAHGRYAAPYLRDALLDAGALVETLETAALWSDLHVLKSAVTEAVQGALGPRTLVLCHISHVYAAGASLYFTVATAQGDDPVAQWRTAKTAALTAIAETRGTVSHHHGVGRDHRDALACEIGELGVAAIRAVKAAWDPHGIMNPGVLIR